MADTLSDIKSQLRHRLDELRPLVEEYRELEQVATALSASPEAASPDGASRRSGRRPKRAAARSARAPRGANKQKVFAVIGERPGVTVGEIAQAASLAKPVIYNTTRSGVEKGELEPVDLGGGRKGFKLAASGGEEDATT